MVNWINTLAYLPLITFASYSMFEAYQEIKLKTDLLHAKAQVCGSDTEEVNKLKSRILSLNFIVVLDAIIIALALILYLDCSEYRQKQSFLRGKAIKTGMNVMIIVLLILVLVYSFSSKKLQTTKIGAIVFMLLITGLIFIDYKTKVLQVGSKFVPQSVKDKAQNISDKAQSVKDKAQKIKDRGKKLLDERRQEKEDLAEALAIVKKKQKRKKKTTDDFDESEIADYAAIAGFNNPGKYYGYA